MSYLTVGCFDMAKAKVLSERSSVTTTSTALSAVTSSVSSTQRC